MGHNETQKKEETNIAYMLSEYLSIPFHYCPLKMDKVKN